MTDVSKIASLILEKKKNERRDFCTAQMIFFSVFFFFLCSNHATQSSTRESAFLPSGISCGDTFSLGDATFLFYVNKSLGAGEGRGLSVNFDY